ncbi:hypothetical protein J6590_030972 [Homalodisca vitripennis]|nr:hypothetical protein J6590_030972 [Homalodisca vitripennis]
MAQRCGGSEDFNKSHRFHINHSQLKLQVYSSFSSAPLMERLAIRLALKEKRQSHEYDACRLNLSDLIISVVVNDRVVS